MESDDWLSRQFGYPVYRFTFDEGHPPDEDAIRDAVNESGKSFIYTRTDVSDPSRTDPFIRAGFSLVETSVELGKEVMGGDPPEFSGCDITFADQSDRDNTVDLASRGFSLSRFHSDPLIDDAIADQIKASWTGNFFSGKRGTHMAVAKNAGAVIGFILLDVRPDSFQIDLMAVDAGWRGKGVGSSLVKFTEKAFPDRKYISVTTELRNTEAVNLYLRNGFYLLGGAYTLHLHKE